MKVKVYADAAELAREVAGQLARRLEIPGNVGFATGRTMDPLYAALRAHPPTTMEAHAWMLDEYLGLAFEDSRTFGAYLKEQVFLPLGYPLDLLCLPNLRAFPPAEAAQEYEWRLEAAGGLDVQLLGIGHNGHVGFNEPGSKASSRSRVVQIAERTRLANSAGFGGVEHVPRQAVTLGLANIASARELWLLATGEGKSEIVRRFLEAEVSEDVPATLLRSHPGLTVYLDRAAASLLSQPVG